MTEFILICTSCGLIDDKKVKERYSFGIYAGKLCENCCNTYRDNCGLDQPQGNPITLDEFKFGGWNAIDGEPA